VTTQTLKSGSRRIPLVSFPQHQHFMEVAPVPILGSAVLTPKTGVPTLPGRVPNPKFPVPTRETPVPILKTRVPAPKNRVPIA
jgi:hypothetical protein